MAAVIPRVSSGATSGRPPLRVLLVDDDPLVRSGLRVILSSADDLEVVGEAPTGRPPSPPSARTGPRSC